MINLYGFKDWGYSIENIKEKINSFIEKKGNKEDRDWWFQTEYLLYEGGNCVFLGTPNVNAFLVDLNKIHYNKWKKEGK